jgi:hypothetical protein
MAFVHDFHLRPLESQLKQSDDTVLSKLRGYRAASHFREFLFDPPYILGGLNDANWSLPPLACTGMT